MLAVTGLLSYEICESFDVESVTLYLYRCQLCSEVKSTPRRLRFASENLCNLVILFYNDLLFCFRREFPIKETTGCNKYSDELCDSQIFHLHYVGTSSNKGRLGSSTILPRL